VRTVKCELPAVLTGRGVPDGVGNQLGHDQFHVVGAGRPTRMPRTNLRADGTIAGSSGKVTEVSKPALPRDTPPQS
jgi:hypothetical protein